MKKTLSSLTMSSSPLSLQAAPSTGSNASTSSPAWKQLRHLEGAAKKATLLHSETDNLSDGSSEDDLTEVDVRVAPAPGHWALKGMPRRFQINYVGEYEACRRIDGVTGLRRG